MRKLKPSGNGLSDLSIHMALNRDDSISQASHLDIKSSELICRVVKDYEHRSPQASEPISGPTSSHFSRLALTWQSQLASFLWDASIAIHSRILFSLESPGSWNQFEHSRKALIKLTSTKRVHPSQCWLCSTSSSSGCVKTSFSNCISNAGKSPRPCNEAGKD